MFFPKLVQNLHENILFNHADNIFGNTGVLFGYAVFHLVKDFLLHFVGVDFRLVGPISNRKHKAGNAVELLLEFLFLPFVGRGAVRQVSRNRIRQIFLAHFADGFRNIVGGHQLLALFINDLALVVHDVVIFEQVFANVEVALFHFLLGFFQCLGNPRVD